MCRFAVYLGTEITVSSLVTEPDYSIVHQSFHSRELKEPLNGDGFGISWYVPDVGGSPPVFKDISPAWNNSNLKEIARVTKSGCILAHVRAATPDLPVTRLNCHPFSWGPYAFMHNGALGGFRRIRRTLQEGLRDEAFDLIEGSTDSELIFALFAELILQNETDADPLRRMSSALVRAVQITEEVRKRKEVEEPSFLNIAITDGHRILASRYASPGGPRPHSLYTHSGSAYVCDGGVCRMVEPRSGRGAVIVASEPLSRDSGWEEVPANHLVLIDDDLSVATEAIGQKPV